MMKTGFIRGLWGIFDNSHRITNRRFRVENNINKTLRNKYAPSSQTYVFGKENLIGLEKLGVKNLTLIQEDPFKFDLIKHQYRHKLELIRYAMEVDGYDEILYLDWDCYPTRSLPDDFWEVLRGKGVFQANLIQYHRKKCFWREVDQRKVPNGGFLYIRDKTIPARAIEYWDEMPQDNDEPAWAKIVEDLMGGKWTDINDYWNRFEPEWCNLHKSSPYSPEQLKSKKSCFIHYQGRGN